VSASGRQGGPESEEPLPIEIQTRYERFPASIKGAFVMRGADGNPHAVQIESARVARIPNGPGKPFGVETRIVDVAPGRDLFMPFEAPVSEIEPGWYVIESEARVDAGHVFVFASRPFSVPWPRNDVRRGSIVVEKTVRAGKDRIRIDRVEMGGDAAAVVWWPEAGSAAPPPARVSDAETTPALDAILVADGRQLDVLPPQAGRSGRSDLRSRGEHRTLSYPVPRETKSLAIAVNLASGARSELIELSFR
jgi:hypothetical protein